MSQVEAPFISDSGGKAKMDAAQDQKDPAEADKENEQNGKGLREQQLPPSPEARIPSPTSASEMMTSGDAPSEEPSYGAKSHRELEIVTDYGDTVEPKEEGEEEEDDASPGAEDIGSKSPNTAKTLFWKQLTSSDSNGTGRVVIPKAAAEEHFPRVSSTHGIKLVFLDTFGDKHALQLRFWENKSSKIYLLEGTTPIQRRYKLSKGDTIVFLQSGDGQLHLSGHKGSYAPQPAAGVRVAKSVRPVVEAPGSRKRRKLSKPMQSPLATIDVQYQVDLRVLQDVREDGVFREVKSSEENLQPGIRKSAHNRWIAVLELGGTKYKAFFPNEEDAAQAFSSAGAKMPVAPQRGLKE
mmetsp:Transcript_38811/g.109818  ORF Transcript_38811/g.109818 Transcript_38811/m.109818 type:complete len:352 (-) Transcript_38811:159-1214(-)